MDKVILLTEKFDDGSIVKHKITEDEEIKEILMRSEIKGYIDLETLRPISEVVIENCDISEIDIDSRVEYSSDLDEFMGRFVKV